METLNEVVSAGDLILVYAPGHTACMLLVESSPGSQISNPKTSSITVREVKVHYRLKPGCCIVSGPDVYYNEKEDEDTLGDDTSSEEGCDISSCPLSADVLRYYWGGDCPFCYMDGWYCPGCGPAMQFPDLFGGCAVDQSCPVCYGYDFAMNDKIMLREIEEYESRLWGAKSGPAEYRAELRQEILEMVRERYELIDARRQEMGLSRYDVDDIVEKWFKDDDE
ncbi:hypothetical protein BDV36DRAFT_287343 [Aspergillus pseudocaelatus]|uniref:Uncharacterized protein n=1 Tax=Aspergillus pseudocaelatus TaxID=1825620 RepID=A0ABQ6W7C6_9EURO|nr:hypothetical protein BDV36DRAFT_287343 [Aspergillus pseudocaelatus]